MRTEPDAAGTTGGVGTVDTKRRIAALYERVLAVSHVGDQDDFFLLGGSSLSAIELLDAITDELSVQLPVADFYQGTRVAKLARTVDAHRTSSMERGE